MEYESGKEAAAPAPATPQGSRSGVGLQFASRTARRAQSRDVRAVQARGGDATGDVHQAAADGVSGAGGPLPHLQRIQGAFGKHDVSQVQAHVGGAAKGAADRIGAEAYATGRSVAFREQPSLHTAAHEAAHVVQQRAGVQLRGGVGEAGDPYERHADAVADAVVQGRSAEGLLDRGPGGGGGGPAVQRTPQDVRRVLRRVRRLLGRRFQNPEDARQPAQQSLEAIAGLSEDDQRALANQMTADETRTLRGALTDADRTQHAAVLRVILGERVVSDLESHEDDHYWAGASGADARSSYRISTTAPRRPTTTRRQNPDGTSQVVVGSETNQNDFARWIRGGPEPDDASKMNCWEVVLFSAYRSGVVTLDWLREIHREAAGAGQRADDTLLLRQDAAIRDQVDQMREAQIAQSGTSSLPPADQYDTRPSLEHPQLRQPRERAGEAAYQRVLGRALGVNSARPLTATQKPQRGDLVFFGGLSHVTIATGEEDAGSPMVMSLWLLPRDANRLYDNSVQRTSVRQISGAARTARLGDDPRTPQQEELPVTFGPAPW